VISVQIIKKYAFTRALFHARTLFNASSVKKTPGMEFRSNSSVESTSRPTQGEKLCRMNRPFFKASKRQTFVFQEFVFQAFVVYEFVI